MDGATLQGPGGGPAAEIRDGAGTPRRHESAEKHVAGTAAYVDDAPEPPGMAHCAIGVATIARGRITALDLSPVRAAPGVIRVATADDIPGENNLGPVVPDEPLLAASERGGVGGANGGDHGEAHFYGQPLFLVIADSVEAARRAARLAKITYAEQTPILSIAEAMAAGSVVAPPYRMARDCPDRGDARAAIDAAPQRLSGRMTIGGQEHFYLEGQVAAAYPGEDDEIRVLSSNQHPSECQHLLAHLLGVPSHAVTVEVRRLGGGFGGKETQANLTALCAALAVRLTGRAAKFRLDRDVDMIVTGKRHEFEIDYEVGFDAQGVIHGLRVEQKARCGWSRDLSTAIADRAMFHADNAYFLPAVEIVSHRLRTNTVSNTAFRGFGGPQGMLGMERIIEAVAAAVRTDPAAVRARNFYAPPAAPAAGDTSRSITPYHMVVEDCDLQAMWDTLIQSSDYAERRAEIARWNLTSPVLKRGIAATPVKFGISFTMTHLNQAGALALVYQDGSILLNHGGVEMGQGLYTKVAQVVASAFCVDLDRVRVSATRTDKVPNTSATAASSGSDLNGMAAADACRQIKERLADVARTMAGAEPDAPLAWLPGRIRVGSYELAFDDVVKQAYLSRVSLAASGFYATPKIHWDRDAARGRPFYYFAYGAACAEAVIDTLTGETRILRADIIHDVGKSLNPAVDLGQIEGGFIQGLGWLTTEELWWNAAGALKTHAPSTYKIPTAFDRPETLNMSLWAKGENRELTIRRSKAVGEPPLMLANAAFFAIADAVSAAADHKAFARLDAPATPERVLAAVTQVRADAGMAPGLATGLAAG